MIFLDSYLELDRINMVSILAFDSSTIGRILNEENEQYFQKDYPIFYKNKHGGTLTEDCTCDETHEEELGPGEEKYWDAIDVAL